MAFQSSVERDNWYHMIREIQVGWQLSQGTCKIVSTVDANKEWLKLVYSVK